MISGEVSVYTLNTSIASAFMLLWCIETELSFTSSSSKERIYRYRLSTGIFYVTYLFCYYKFIMAHPNQRRKKCICNWFSFIQIHVRSYSRNGIYVPLFYNCFLCVTGRSIYCRKAHLTIFRKYCYVLSIFYHYARF